MIGAGVQDRAAGSWECGAVIVLRRTGAVERLSGVDKVRLTGFDNSVGSRGIGAKWAVVYSCGSWERLILAFC